MIQVEIAIFNLGILANYFLKISNCGIWLDLIKDTKIFTISKKTFFKSLHQKLGYKKNFTL